MLYCAFICAKILYNTVCNHLESTEMRRNDVMHMLISTAAQVKFCPVFHSDKVGKLLTVNFSVADLSTSKFNDYCKEWGSNRKEANLK